MRKPLTYQKINGFLTNEAPTNIDKQLYERLYLQLAARHLDDVRVSKGR